MSLLLKISILSFSLSVSAYASNMPKEIFLKQLNDRISNLLQTSYEAAVFVEEDLAEAIKQLDSSEIQWTNTLSEYPLLFTGEGRSRILLSSHYSFMSTEEGRISTILTFLFQLKRQLDGSSLPVPKLRIDLFARKFSPELLMVKNECSISLSPLTFPLTHSQREKFVPELLSLMNASDYSYNSREASNVVWIEQKKSTDAGCRGKNRNIVEFTAHMMDVASMNVTSLGEVSNSSCKNNETYIDVALSKLMNKIKTNFSRCNSAFRAN